MDIFAPSMLTAVGFHCRDCLTARRLKCLMLKLAETYERHSFELFDKQIDATLISLGMNFIHSNLREVDRYGFTLRGDLHYK